MNANPSSPAADPLALYVHWPFCVSKCPYCDFNSHVRDSVDQERWRAAMLSDLRHEAAMLPGRRVGSVFFGGGTPSLMPPATVAAVLEEADRLWGFHDRVEITLEANPSSVEAARFADIAAAGVNRVSLGLQALDDETLHFLGRAHSVSEGLDALAVAQSAFARVSFDLIYARPGQSLAAWEAELARALAFGTEHLSLYQLTIEPGTRFATLAAQGKLPPVDPDHAADLFECTQAMTSAAGRPRYEVSNHAASGAESRHNLAYWRYTDYAGIGPGAHGRRGGLATLRRKKPENWLAAVDRNGHGLESEEPLDPRTRALEALLMGLRLTDGLVPDPMIVDPAAIATLERQGLLRVDGAHIATTETGILVLDGVLKAIVAAPPASA